MYYQDLTQSIEYATLINVPAVAVGWLQSDHLFPRGGLTENHLSALYAFCRDPLITTMGRHACDLCDSKGAWVDDPNSSFRFGSGIVCIPSPDRSQVYVCPDMVWHFITAHGYHPPQPFCDALDHAPRRHSPEYLTWFTHVTTFPPKDCATYYETFFANPIPLINTYEPLHGRIGIIALNDTVQRYLSALLQPGFNVEIASHAWEQETTTLLRYDGLVYYAFPLRIEELQGVLSLGLPIVVLVDERNSTPMPPCPTTALCLPFPIERMFTLDDFIYTLRNFFKAKIK